MNKLSGQIDGCCSGLALLKVFVDLVEHVSGLAPVRVALDQVQQKHTVHLRASK